MNDDPLVGLRMTSAPASTPPAIWSPKNTSHEMATLSLPAGASSRAGWSPMIGTAGEVTTSERLDQAAQRHVLAEGHAVDLVVAVDDVAVGLEGDRGVEEVVGPVVLDHPGDQGGVQAAGLVGELVALGIVGQRVDVDHVLGPDHEVDRRLDPQPRLACR